MEKIQEIITKHWKTYQEKHEVQWYKQKVMNQISKCKTEAMGAHKFVCDECGYEEIAYNSCRNRHCPNCQTGKQLKWIEARKEEVLNTKYYHVVFTIPEELNLMAMQNPRKIYSILFKASAETLQELARDKKYLGAEVGFFSILHTWGQEMTYHPHVHMVVTGGGLSKIGTWVEKGSDFFIPVKVMASKFKGKFMDYLKKEKLHFYGENEEYKNPANYDNLKKTLYAKKWVVYCKEPFKNANYVIEYLGRYTHRVAISNDRITKVNEKEVTFKYKDYKEGNKIKERTITCEEFIRRFLLHILPLQFMKIRHYGILGNRNKKTILVKCKKLTQTPIKEESNSQKKRTVIEYIKQAIGRDINLCPCCKNGHLILVT